ncbi:SDR family oxidoreductase [Sporichthya brevicatena]|uniref:SDR family oxidoreductase n=1 Tax=Sporichthya brevicatena TaxID=171442 RepID=A0ABN1HBW3_9ACTN
MTSSSSTSTPLADNVALVTGATSGIGRAAAEHLAELGAHVLVSGRDVERGEAVVATIRAAGGKADFLAADLADVYGARDLAQRAIEAGGGRVDILVNNAGIFPFGSTVEFSNDDFDAVVGVNLKSPFALVQALVPGMVERGAGTVVNVSSAAGQRALPAAGVYSATKAALDQLTRSWAAEFGPSGVRVNAVSPGPVRTEGTVDFTDLHAEFAEISPSRRVSEPADIAAAIGFLAGPGASNIHGTVLPVDGGYLAA